MGIFDTFKKIFSSTVDKAEVKDALIEKEFIKKQKRDGVEKFLRETFKDEETIDYGLYLYDEAELEQRKKVLENRVKARAMEEGNAEIQNRFTTWITEPPEEGIYGYSTRDEVRAERSDAEIERFLKDPKVRASYQVLSAQVFADPLIVEARNDSDQAQLGKKYIDTCIDELDGSLRQVLREGLTVGLSFQNAFFEKVSGWSKHPDFKGKRIYKKLASRRPGLLEFITDDYDNVKAVHSLVNLSMYYPLSRFLIVNFENMFSNPYGVTLFGGAYKFWKAKLYVFQQMTIFANRYAQPLPVVQYRDPKQQETAQALSNKLYSGLNVAVPEGVQAEFLKAMESGSQNPYIVILEWLDKQISLAICGIDLSQGSYASDKVIADERDQIILSLREDLEEIVYEQFVKPLCEDNLNITIDNYPKVRFKAPRKPLTAEQLTAALPQLFEEDIIIKSSLKDINFLRTFYGLGELTEEEFEGSIEEEFIEVEDEPKKNPEALTMTDI